MKRIVIFGLLAFACGRANALVLYYDKTNTCNDFYLNIPTSGCSGGVSSVSINVSDQDNASFDGYYVNGIKIIDSNGSIVKTPGYLANNGVNLTDAQIPPKFTCNDGYEEDAYGTCVETGTGGGDTPTQIGNRFFTYKCSGGGEDSEWIRIQSGVPFQIPLPTVCADYGNNSNYRFDGWSWKNGITFQGGEWHTFNEGDYSLPYDDPAKVGFITVYAKWTGANSIETATNRANCEYVGGHWCTTAGGVFVGANTPHFSCYNSSNATDMCCYDDPEQCSYWQCKIMKFYWETPNIAPAVNFNYQYCTADDFNRIEIKATKQYFSSLYAWSPLMISFTGHRDASNPNSNFIYVDTDTYYEDVGRVGANFPTKRTKLYKIQTRFRETDIHGGYYFDGYYTGENCTGTKCIDHDGNILPVACSGELYECWNELDNTEPAEGVTKLYYGTCDAIPRCWEFTGVPEGDPRYHGTWYGPLYTKGNGRILYTDKDATQVAEYAPHVSSDRWGSAGWYYRLSYKGYLDHRFPDSPGNSFTSMQVGPNKNRLLLFPADSRDIPSSYTVSIQYDCGEGEIYGGCDSIPHFATLYDGGYLKPKRSAAPNDISNEGCFCHKNTRLPCGWRNPANGEILYTTGQAYGPWTYGDQTLTAVYDCDR
ncbi:MAG: hypothetical protein J5742_04255 [Alphaproteobacteria bacterium]|nr:hypothetical protein [Alphaproteobacteria bacterium]